LEHLSLIAEAPEEEIAQAHEQLDRTRELVEAYKQADSRAKQGRNRLSTRINELETGIREANELAGRAREFLEALENVETSLSGLLEQGPIKVDDNSRGADIDQDDISNIKIRLAE
jgi:chromosome segregation ATPase